MAVGNVGTSLSGECGLDQIHFLKNLHEWGLEIGSFSKCSQEILICSLVWK